MSFCLLTSLFLLSKEANSCKFGAGKSSLSCTFRGIHMDGRAARSRDGAGAVAPWSSVTHRVGTSFVGHLHVGGFAVESPVLPQAPFTLTVALIRTHVSGWAHSQGF